MMQRCRRRRRLGGLTIGASDVRHASRPQRRSPNLPMDAVGAWAGRHDGNLQPAICLDPLRQTVPDGDRRRAARNPGHLLAAGRVADVALAVPGLADRALRCPFLDHAWLYIERTWLDYLGRNR